MNQKGLLVAKKGILEVQGCRLRKQQGVLNVVGNHHSDQSVASRESNDTRKLNSRRLDPPSGRGTPFCILHSRIHKHHPWFGLTLIILLFFFAPPRHYLRLERWTTELLSSQGGQPSFCHHMVDTSHHIFSPWQS